MIIERNFRIVLGRTASILTAKQFIFIFFYKFSCLFLNFFNMRLLCEVYLLLFDMKVSQRNPIDNVKNTILIIYYN